MIVQRALELWILLCAGLACAGWVFSAFSALGGIAYVCFLFVLGLAAVFVAQNFGGQRIHWRRDLRKTLRRFRRLPALLFLGLVVGSVIGALAYPTIHFDSLSYRLPRVLHWLAEGQWHWIHTPDRRMNVVATGTEWLWTPIMLATDSERVLAATNLVSYCFLPGLIYAFFIRVGIKRRLAWWWMWILPAGYCYALQAGSLATDAYATIFSLGAVVYAFKAAEKRSPYCFWLSLLAVGFATGIKQSNLLLVPVWCIAALSARKVFFLRPWATALVVAVALLASFLPNCIANMRFAGRWDGLNIDPPSRFWAFVGNSFALPMENLLPPIFPPAREWNAAMARFMETPFGSNFGFYDLFAGLYRGPNENVCGLGLTTCLLLLTGLLSFRRRPRRDGCSPAGFIRMGVLVLPWLLMFVYLVTIAISRSARYLAFFYPFLFAGILYLTDRPDRFRWWRAGACLSIVLTLGTLVLLRQRPLVPVKLVAAGAERFVSKSLADRARTAFSFVATVRDTIDAFHHALPPETKVAAYISELGNLEGALWHPYGSRRVWRYGAADMNRPGFEEELASKGIRYAILDQLSLKKTNPSSIEEWLVKYNAEVVFMQGMPEEPDMPLRPVWLVRFQR